MTSSTPPATADLAPSSAPGGLVKSVVGLDRVVIRFAGDSGDGMQLTGDRFTSETAAFGNDLSTLPNFPAEIRAPAGTLPGVSSFQLHFADYDILTPGDAPDVLVAMNPAALQGEPRPTCPAARRSSSTPTSSRKRNLAKVGYAEQPARGRLARRLAPVHAVPLTSHDGRGAQPTSSVSQEGRRAGQEHVRARPAVLDVLPADRGHGRGSWSEKFAPQAGDRRGQHRRASGPAATSARPPRPSRSATRSSRRRMPPGTLPQHHRQPGAGAAASWRAGQRSGLPLFLGAYPITPASRHPARAVQAQALRRAHVPGRGRDRRRSAPRSAPPSAARSASPPRPGPGIALKGETIGLAVMTGAAAGDRRRPARRPVDRPADQDRAGRPAAGAVRPQRRGAGAGHRAALAGRLLRRRARGGADRADVPDAGDPAVRRLHRQRLRAVAAAGRRRRCPTSRVEFATEPNGEDGEFLPYLRDPETLARPWAIPGTPGLEHRIGGLEKADKTGNISYDPANHDFMVRTRQAKVDGIADRLPPTEVDDPTGDAHGARARLGLDLRPDRRRLPAGPAAGPHGGAGPPAAPQPVAGQPRRGAARATTRWSSRR